MGAGETLQVASVAAAEVGQVGQALAKAAEKTEEALSSEAGARGWLVGVLKLQPKGQVKSGQFLVDLSLLNLLSLNGLNDKKHSLPIFRKVYPTQQLLNGLAQMLFEPANPNQIKVQRWWPLSNHCPERSRPALQGKKTRNFVLQGGTPKDLMYAIWINMVLGTAFGV